METKTITIVTEFYFKVPADYEPSGNEFLQLSETEEIKVMDYRKGQLLNIPVDGVPEYNTTQVLIETEDGDDEVQSYE